MEDLMEKLFEEIAHGDAEHREWLREKLTDFANRHQNISNRLNKFETLERTVQFEMLKPDRDLNSIGKQVVAFLGYNVQ